MSWPWIHVTVTPVLMRRPGIRQKPPASPLTCAHGVTYTTTNPLSPHHINPRHPPTHAHVQSPRPLPNCRLPLTGGHRSRASIANRQQAPSPTTPASTPLQAEHLTNPRTIYPKGVKVVAGDDSHAKEAVSRMEPCPSSQNDAAAVFLGRLGSWLFPTRLPRHPPVLIVASSPACSPGGG